MARISIRAFQRLERRACRRRSALRAVYASFDLRSQSLVVVLPNGNELRAPRKLLLPLTGAGFRT